MHIKQAANQKVVSQATQNLVTFLTTHLETMTYRLIVSIIRDYDEYPSKEFTEAVASLHDITYHTPREIIQEGIVLLTHCYEQSQRKGQLNQFRGQVVEQVTYEVVQPFYDPGCCFVNALVYAHDNHREEITHAEIDICAWDAATSFGEAYECKVNPYRLEHEDCTNLLAIAKECEKHHHAYRIGVVSFESSFLIEQRLYQLKANPHIQAIGYDNMHHLR